MIDVQHTLLIITVVAVLTVLLRATPFLIFGSRKTMPNWINKLGKFLPPAIMTTLVFYCLRNIDFRLGNHGLPELVATAIVIALHSWKKNILLTVAVGTVCYMLMV